MVKKLTEKQMECLWNLPNPGDDWRTPMYMGAWNSSHHSGTLRQLAIMGLAVRKFRYSDAEPETPEEVKTGKRYINGRRYWLSGPYKYQATAEGKARWRAQLAEERALEQEDK